MQLRIAIAASAAAFIFFPAWAAASEAGRVLPSARSRATHHTLLRPPQVPADRELEAAGAVIGNVEIAIGNVFDTDDPQEDSALPRLANRLHIRTRQHTVESLLLFKSGERYSGRALEESERILRTTRYLYDARVRPVSWHDGKVDIEVRTRDVWTLNPGVSFGRRGGKNTSGFELEELNLLGFGSQLSLGFKSGIDRDSATLLYRDRQIFGSWWDLKAEASDNSDGRAHELSLERPFYALDTRWAAGVSARDDTRVDSQYDLGHIVNQFRTHEKLTTLYGGWSAGLNEIGMTHRWTAGVTLDDNQFDLAPGLLQSNLIPADRKLVYPWIGYEWLQDRFFKARNRDQIEKTEDFNLGWRFNTRVGFASSAFGSDRDAVILNAGLSKGFEPTERQTFLWSTAVASRIEHGDFVNALAGTSGRYYFRQSPRRLLFTALQVDVSSKLDPDRQLLLGGDNGLRGYPLRFQGGEGRWLFTAEQRGFSNWYPFRLFNVGGAVFFDAGRTWGDNPLGTPSQGLLKDIGVGLRLGNSRSALGNVLHIDFALPLDGGSGISKLQFLVETKRTF
jgi:outer membrane protein assembly factor BamA